MFVLLAYIVTIIVSCILTIFIVISEDRLDPEHRYYAHDLSTILVIQIIPLVNVFIGLIGCILYYKTIKTILFGKK